jgi:hypothetical protein
VLPWQLYFRHFMFGKYNGFVSKARVSACMYFLVIAYISIQSLHTIRSNFLWQREHSYSFSLWVFLCRFRLPARLNVLPHSSQHNPDFSVSSCQSSHSARVCSCVSGDQDSNISSVVMAQSWRLTSSFSRSAVNWSLLKICTKNTSRFALKT